MDFHHIPFSLLLPSTLPGKDNNSETKKSIFLPQEKETCILLALCRVFCPRLSNRIIDVMPKEYEDCTKV